MHRAAVQEVGRDDLQLVEAGFPINTLAIQQQGDRNVG